MHKRSEIYTHTHRHASKHINVRVYANAHNAITHRDMHIYTYKNTLTFTYTRIHLNTHALMHTCTYKHTNVLDHTALTRARTHTRTHTQMHTHKQTPTRIYRSTRTHTTKKEIGVITLQETFAVSGKTDGDNFISLFVDTSSTPSHSYVTDLSEEDQNIIALRFLTRHKDMWKVHHQKRRNW